MKHLLLTLAISTLLATSAQAYEISSGKSIESISGLEVNGTSYSVHFQNIRITGIVEPGDENLGQETLDASYEFGTPYVASQTIDLQGGTILTSNNITAFTEALFAALNNEEQQFIAEQMEDWNQTSSFSPEHTSVHGANQFFLLYSTGLDGAYFYKDISGPGDPEQMPDWMYTNTYDYWSLMPGDSFYSAVAVVTEDAPVPVPSSLILLAMGMLTLTGVRTYRMSGKQH